MPATTTYSCDICGHDVPKRFIYTPFEFKRAENGNLQFAFNVAHPVNTNAILCDDHLESLRRACTKWFESLPIYE